MSDYSTGSPCLRRARLVRPPGVHHGRTVPEIRVLTENNIYALDLCKIIRVDQRLTNCHRLVFLDLDHKLSPPVLTSTKSTCSIPCDIPKYLLSKATYVCLGLPKDATEYLWNQYLEWIHSPSNRMVPHACETTFINQLLAYLDEVMPPSNLMSEPWLNLLSNLGIEWNRSMESDSCNRQQVTAQLCSMVKQKIGGYFYWLRRLDKKVTAWFAAQEKFYLTNLAAHLRREQAAEQLASAPRPITPAEQIRSDTVDLPPAQGPMRAVTPYRYTVLPDGDFELHPEGPDRIDDGLCTPTIRPVSPSSSGLTAPATSSTPEHTPDGPDRIDDDFSTPTIRSVSPSCAGLTPSPTSSEPEHPTLSVVIASQIELPPRAPRTRRLGDGLESIALAFCTPSYWLTGRACQR